MIIDLILDRKDGYRYNAHEFYGEVMEYIVILAKSMQCSRTNNFDLNKSLNCSSLPPVHDSGMKRLYVMEVLNY